MSPGRRAALRALLLPAAAVLLLGAVEAPTPPQSLPPAEAAKQGRLLAAELAAQRPAENSTNSGILKIRVSREQRSETAVTFAVRMTETNWMNFYLAQTPTNRVLLEILHNEGSNEYRLGGNDPDSFTLLAGNATMIPFAGSDFWVADLGLEFLRWPEQRLVRTQMRSGRSCRVLESVNPQPAPGAYSRVLCWLDRETGGIVHAEAYDFKDKLLKEFDPKEFKKVQGQWQLQEMEIANRQSGSRTRIEFNVTWK